MKQIVLRIPDNEYRFFLRIIKNFPFIEIDEKKKKLLELEEKLTPTNKKIWDSIKEGLKETELVENGKIEAKSAKEYLNGL